MSPRPSPRKRYMYRHATRVIGGVRFESWGPGHWLSVDGRLALLHLMRGSVLSEWHLFRTRPGEKPRKPFDDVDFWGWDDLTYTITMGEMDKQVVELRERSRAMLSQLKVDETIVRCGKELRLVIGVHPDGDDIGAILDVEAEVATLDVEQWSTYGCSITTFPDTWPKWKRPNKSEDRR